MIKPCILVHCEADGTYVIERAFVGEGAFAAAQKYINWCKDKDKEIGLSPAEYSTSVVELEILDEYPFK